MLWVLIGWQFTLAEYIGGLVMIVLMAVLLRAVRLSAVGGRSARARPAGRHRPPAPHRPASTMTLAAAPYLSVDAWSDVAHNFRGDWQMLWKEITIGFLLAGFVAQLGNGFFNASVPHGALRPIPPRSRRARRPPDRGAELRLLGRQRAARRRPVVRRHLLRRRDGVHLRRPDRAADHRDLSQVLRQDVTHCGSSH